MYYKSLCFVCSDACLPITPFTFYTSSNSCTGFGDVASMMVLLFEVSMRWVGVRLDVVAGLVTFSACTVFVISKGSFTPAAAALVLSICGKVC